MSSYRSYQSQRPRPEGLLGSLDDTQPTQTKTTKPLSGIPLPSRSQTSRAPASFSRNRQNHNENAVVSRTDIGERPSATPRGSSSLSSRSSESTTKVASAGSRSFGFRSTKATVPAEKEKPRNVLRQKAPSIDQRPGATRTRAKSDASEVDDMPLKGF